jgi:hypothetical protein
MIYNEASTRSCNIYASSSIVRVCYKFTLTDRFYGYLMSPATIKRIQVFIQNVWYLWSILSKFGFSQNIFYKSAQDQISRESIQCEPRSNETRGTEGRMDGQTDITKETGAFHDYVNKPKIVFLFHNRDDFRYNDKKVQSVINNCCSF